MSNKNPADLKDSTYSNNTIDDTDLKLSDQALNSPLFIKDNPLPLEILEMSQEETACKYCGISYLLLTKYEKMSKELMEIQEELRKNRKITLERPGLLSRIDALTKLQQESSDKVGDLEKLVDNFKTQILNDSSHLNNLQQENISLKTELSKQDLLYKRKIQNSQREKQGNYKDLQEKSKMLLDIVKITIAKMQEQEANIRELFKVSREQWEINASIILTKTVNQVKKSLEEKYDSNTNILKNEIKDLNSTIQEYKNENETSEETIQDLKNQVINGNIGFKLEVDQLNSDKITLNSKILELEKELQRSKGELVKEGEKFDILQARFEKVNQQMEYQETILSDKLSEKDAQIQQLQEEIEAYRKSSEAVQSLATQAGVGLAKKDEKILYLEKSLKTLKEQVNTLTVEREKTIEAHQSRIKQLQDNFLEKLKHAGKEEAEKAHEQTRRIMNAEKEAAIKEWTIQLQEDFDAKEKVLKDQQLVLKSKMEDFKRQMTRREDDWKKKCDMLIEQNKKAQDSNTADFEHYQTRIRTLEAEIIKNQAAPAAEGPLPNLKEISDLKAVIEKRNAEILFLKDTVRLECEERISLIAKLAVLTQNGTIPIQKLPTIPKSVSCTLPTAPISQNADSRESSTSVPSRKTFESMMHEATIKKEKKLAKSSSRKKFFGI